MPYRVYWYIPQRIVYVKLSGEITSDDAVMVSEEIKQLLDQGETPVYILSDETEITNISINVLGTWDHLKILRDPRIGYNVTLSKLNPSVEFVAMLINKFIDFKLKRFKDMTALHNFLQEKDPSLPLPHSDEV